jgi:hypothetical protein
VKKIKAETVKKCFAKAGFGESDTADYLKDASDTISVLFSFSQGSNDK